MSRPILMIPGPIEFHEDVLKALGEPSPSHVAPSFIETFGKCLEQTAEVYGCKDGEAVILSGSGALGWDVISSNLVAPEENVLIVNTGYFGDRWGSCFEAYRANVDHVRAEVGAAPTLAQIETQLKSKTYAMITITQVDTSTGVLADVKGIAQLARKLQPKILIAVDGVCSIGAEELLMDEWTIDAAMTASQKALGAPPGLCVMAFSSRALAVAAGRTTPVLSCFGDLANWLPIMRAYRARKPSYFGTPNVNLIKALQVSLSQIIAAGGMKARTKKHVEVAARVQDFLVKEMGLKLVPASGLAANSLTAVRFPAGVSKEELLPKIKAQGVILAGGLHPKIKKEYFRIGHMGISATEDARGHITKTIEAIKKALLDCGHKASL